MNIPETNGPHWAELELPTDAELEAIIQEHIEAHNGQGV
jgi:hypothetical protein